jgi:hypothetical protein
MYMRVRTHSVSRETTTAFCNPNKKKKIVPHRGNDDGYRLIILDKGRSEITTNTP